MKQHPILFSTPMVEAILEGNKTMTRRVVKPQIRNGVIPQYHPDGYYLLKDYMTGFFDKLKPKCPYGQVGDVLWVRESWTQNGLGYYRHKADWNETPKNHGTFIGQSVPDKFRGKWKPSIHMPKEACRLFLQITNIRVERLQAISKKDAYAEGIKNELYLDSVGGPISKEEENNNLKSHLQSLVDYNPISDFKNLWDKINGKKHPWNSNPWVWVIEFKQIEKPC